MGQKPGKTAGSPLPCHNTTEADIRYHYRCGNVAYIGKAHIAL